MTVITNMVAAIINPYIVFMIFLFFDISYSLLFNSLDNIMNIAETANKVIDIAFIWNSNFRFPKL